MPWFRDAGSSGVAAWLAAAPISTGVQNQTRCAAGHNEVMADRGPTVSVRPYDRTRGAVAEVEGGDLVVSFDGGEVVIAGNPAGLRDLARWCLVISDEVAPEGVHVHLDPNVDPLTIDSLPIVIRRQS